jgi:hypothetical protein
MAPAPPLPRPAHRHKKKAAKTSCSHAERKGHQRKRSGPSLGEIPVVDSLRNFLTAPSEEILGTLTAMQDMVSRQSGVYG